VEVIVVLLIIAVLSAIGIPSLSGYIDQANHKQYISDARNKSIAVRSALLEIYATGGLDENGESILNEYSKAIGDKPSYNVWSIESSDGDAFSVYRRAAALMGTTYPEKPNFYFDDSRWIYYQVGSENSTRWNADGFIYLLFPEGHDTGRKENAILVTYKLKRVEGLIRWTNNADIDSTLDSMVYDANAGYEVYILEDNHSFYAMA
jgi:type II secretory pathway pseudopilin PulG